MKPVSALLLALCLAASGCGTNYDVPEVSQTDLQSARSVLAEEEARADADAILNRDPEVIVDDFIEVVRRVEPVAEAFCAEQTADQPGFDCDVTVLVDADIEAYPNAFQFFDDQGRPVILFNLPFIARARNQDELAFVFGHEMGHLVAEHIDKQERQGEATAVLAGTLMGLLQLGAGDVGGLIDFGGVDAAMSAGERWGQGAYSQTYELEADVIGAYIAERAGYDPATGVRVFARRGDAEAGEETASFWSTHPQSPERVGAVMATLREIEAQRAAGLTPSPH